MSLGGKRIGEGLDRSLERKVDHGRDQLAHIGSRHLGNKLGEDQLHPRADGNMAVILSQRRHPAHAADFDVLQDVMVLLRPIVKFEDDPVRPDLELGDHHAVTGFRRNTVLLQLLGVAISRRAQLPVGMEHDALRTQRKRPHGKGFVGLERTDQLLLGPLGQRLGIKRDGRGLDGGEIGFFWTQLFPLHGEHLCMA